MIYCSAPLRDLAKNTKQNFRVCVKLIVQFLIVTFFSTKEEVEEKDCRDKEDKMERAACNQ